MTTYYVSYCRVSTTKQGASGLGLEAQQATVREYLDKQGAAPEDLLEEFIEVESGSHDDRPQLAAALRRCDLTGAVLLVAKLDRLSRDVHFISSLQKAGISFVVCDFPDANSFTIHIFAALAQYERELISERTKRALIAARARGQRLGSPGNLPADATKARESSVNARRRKAEQFAVKLAPDIVQCRSEGMSLQDVADRFNANKTKTASGKTNAWTATAVRRVLVAGGGR